MILELISKFYTVETCLMVTPLNTVTSWRNAQTFSYKKTMLIRPPPHIKPMATFWNPNSIKPVY